MAEDLVNGFTPIQALEPVAQAGTDTEVNGLTVDMQDAQKILFMAILGAEGDTLSPTVAIEIGIEHSTDGSAWTRCADADLVGAVTGVLTGTFAVVNIAAEANLTYTAAYIGGLRYARLVVSVIGANTNGTVVGGTALLEEKYAA